jgi:hypothetical protein
MFIAVSEQQGNGMERNRMGKEKKRKKKGKSK